jgi:hypothetical protein
MAEPLGERDRSLDAARGLVGLAAHPVHPSDPGAARDARIVATVDRHVRRMRRRIVERQRALEMLLRLVELHQIVQRHAVAVVRLHLREAVVAPLAEREQLLADVARARVLAAHLVERDEAAQQREEMRGRRRPGATARGRVRTRAPPRAPRSRAST